MAISFFVVHDVSCRATSGTFFQGQYFLAQSHLRGLARNVAMGVGACTTKTRCRHEGIARLDRNGAGLFHARFLSVAVMRERQKNKTARGDRLDPGRWR